MKTILPLLTFLCFAGHMFSQNAPVALNDTIYVGFNDSITINANSILTNNDSDPDGDNIFSDTAYYSGLGDFNIRKISNLFFIDYKPELDFYGLDSAKFVIKDDGVPVRYDTSTIYFIVKRKTYDYIDLNNIKARVGINALFHDDKNAYAGFEVPKGSGAHTIYAANLWVAGLDVNGQLKGNVETYNSGGRNFAGPFRTTNQYKTYEEKWDRVWKINHTDIIYHQNNWNNGGYQPIEVIESWPANPDTSKGEYSHLAPFVDRNNDGIYDPYDGDYPKIKGQQAIFFITNDIRDTNTITGMSSMGTELHIMAYAYNCSLDSAINNTVFVDYTIFNRSAYTYNNTYVGAWVDIDIGGHNDDYIGCDVQRGTFYGYNGDDFDSDDGAGIGYGWYPPAQGVTFLGGPYKDYDGIDNPLTMVKQDALDSNGIPYAGLGLGYGDGIVDNEQLGMSHFVYYNNSVSSVQGDPQSPLDYYSYLRGRWRDGTQMVWGGNAHFSSGGTIPSNYMFPGISDPIGWSTPSVSGAPSPSLWSEKTEGNVPLDRRGLGSTGPFTFEPGEVDEITLAFVFGRDYQTPGADAGVVVMQERVDSIRSYYTNGFASVCGGALSVSKNKKANNSLLVYPNPFHNQFAVVYELKNEDATISVYNIIGEEVIQQAVQQKTTLIDLSNQANGVYFVQVIDGSNRITQKVLKQ
ncbi:MAG: T9SS type A sorting domain-containing protein [Vicingus serpentipes]|nr:T9SS type A sorting domain-containing protein [Vicingus serpentipes]